MFLRKLLILSLKVDFQIVIEWKNFVSKWLYCIDRICSCYEMYTPV